jgi:hypothetical protein
MAAPRGQALNCSHRSRCGYIVAKAAMITAATAGALLAYGCGGTLLLLAILIPKSGGSYTTLLQLIGGLIACFATGSWLTCSACVWSEDLVHVPPLSEQIASLGARGLLLRAASDDGPTRSELLRAVPASAAKEAGRLLRPAPEPADCGDNGQVDRGLRAGRARG